MPTCFPEIFEALAAEFHKDELKYQEFQKFWYVTARAVANRLDRVLGPENWEGEPLPWNDTAVKYRLTLIMPDGTTITKYALGAKSTLAKKALAKGKDNVDPGEDDKGGDSDGLKRAAALFGVARYLYGEPGVRFQSRDGTEGAETPPAPAADVEPSKAARLAVWCRKKGLMGQAAALARRNYQKSVDDLEDEEADATYRLIQQMNAKPEAEIVTNPPPPPGTREAADVPGSNPNGSAQYFGWPNSGAALYAWTMKLQDAFGVSLVKGDDGADAVFVNGKGWDRAWKTWTHDQVEEAVLHIAGIVATLDGYRGQFAGKIPDIPALRDRVWLAASELLKSLNVAPTIPAIKQKIAEVSRHICTSHGGEVVEDVSACDDAALLKELAEALEADLKDAQAFAN